DLKAQAAAISGATDPAAPVARRLITNDVTVEKLGELLRDNPNGLLVYRDELSGFLRTLDKQGHESDRSFYLESWNGTGSFTYDRSGRGTGHVRGVGRWRVGGIQAGPLAAYVRGATAGGGDDGLISRFQLAVFPDQGREFKIVDRQPDVGARNRAYKIYEAIDK